MMLAWKLRGALAPTARMRMRRTADALLWPIGSISGAATSGRRMALTFDDGPDSTVTSRLLDLLRARSVQATFFVLTEKAAAAPELIRRMADEGHEIALHADRHDRFTSMPLRQLRARLRNARRELERLANQRVLLVRPPFGSQNLGTFLVARSIGLDVVVWGPYAEDWIESEPADIAARALQNLRGGDILLMHDGLELPEGEPVPRFDRIKATDLVLQGVEHLGLQAGTVSAMLKKHGVRRTAWFRP